MNKAATKVCKPAGWYCSCHQPPLELRALESRRVAVAPLDRYTHTQPARAIHTNTHARTRTYARGSQTAAVKHVWRWLWIFRPWTFDAGSAQQPRAVECWRFFCLNWHRRRACECVVHGGSDRRRYVCASHRGPACLPSAVGWTFGRTPLYAPPACAAQQKRDGSGFNDSVCTCFIQNKMGA